MVIWNIALTFFKHLWAVAPALLALAVGIWQGWWEVDRVLPISVFYILLALGIIVAVFLTYRELKNRKATVTEKSPYLNLYKITPILRKMDRYLWKIADERKIKYLNIEKYRQLGTKLNAIIGVKTHNTLNPNQTANELINKVKSSIRKTEKEVLALIGEGNTDLKQIKDITKLIDDDGFGLKREKEERKYRGFQKKVSRYYDENNKLMDKGLQALITLHISLSEFFANGLMIMKELDYVTTTTRVPNYKQLVTPTTQANLGNPEQDTDERLNEVRTSISEYIREMEAISKNNTIKE